MAAKLIPRNVNYLLGKCLPSSKENAAKIQVHRMVLDKYILMYFREQEIYYADDPEKQCKVGDTVLIRSLPQKKTRLISHEIVDVIHPLGDVTDPVTGKKVVGAKYRSQMVEDRKLFGKNKSGFDYDKAPQRGFTENKRDFTSKKMVRKLYEDPNNPYTRK